MNDEDNLEYATRDDVNIAILREMSKIRFRERLRRVMSALAHRLVAAGVDFSKVDYSKVEDATDEEIDSVYEDLF